MARIMGQTDSRPQQASANKVVITSDEAVQRGIPSRQPIPKPDVCQFCGKIMYRTGIVIDGAVWFWKPCPERCDCEKAADYWRKIDEMTKAEDELRKEEKRKSELREKAERLLGECGIKKRFQQRTFERFRCDTAERTSAYIAAKSYADNFVYHRKNGEGLYIEGTNGTGKTHLAAAIALQLISQGTPVICKTAGDMLGDIKRAFSQPDVKEHEVLEVYKRADLLILDDLGKEQCSDWSISTLYGIINDRYEDMMPTIVTTNYNANGLIEALTPRGSDNLKARAIISRLREVNKVITMAWRDCREG